ncbi:hypothetical protein SMZ82_002809 [Cronobacter malonaticus]|uniref:hypothetical protein n=1 Tax=Cronobacter malonaticus TaxID=413503 RepID=UPI000B267655|nr:hypothetical protein [Cronobacter malonaticus]EKY3233137.1 hypothetical protein [Cronobacter malonaticus]ELQ6263795.1 hypothetical protein [Cronobacter malonaticus]ELY2514397.1 hypothetical protein [Cronobacter malonaticus]ELY2768077.1 hypothetical protein [Cronobacter malonaticus]ELY4026172.1 hypothetical protein [Cronobacter malonaticus]
MDKTVRKVRIRAHHATSNAKVNLPEIAFYSRNSLSMNSLHLSVTALTIFVFIYL